MKERIKILVYSFIKNDGLLILAAGIVFVCIKVSLFDDPSIQIIDWTIFFSIIATILLELFTKVIKKFILNKLEDSVKLEPDYKKIIYKYYGESFLKYNNKNAFPENKKIVKKELIKDEEVSFPVICEGYLEGRNIEIDDSTELFKLPQIIYDHFGDIFQAHETSGVYNQLNIRVTGWNMKDSANFEIKTARTTYFYSLVTNRAMDYKWNGLTVRELFECGPFIHSLEESNLSNHLGFNGFVETSDRYIIFIKRNKNLSIGKMTYGTSVSATIKTKYALDKNKYFTKKGLQNAILSEVRDELKIDSRDIERFSFERNLIAVYRDLVEGGKPQLLVYMKSRKSKNEIIDDFQRSIKNKSSKNNLLEDGNIALCIDRMSLKDLVILPNCIIYKGKKYKMTFSTTASIVMLIKVLEKRNEL